MFFVSLASFVEGASGQSETAQTTPLFGFDFELGTQHLANLVPHFDIDRLESRLRVDPQTWRGVLDVGILDDYITYPGALESLPDGELKQSLLKGLNLRSALVETDVPPPQLILPDYLKPKSTPPPRMRKTEAGVMAPVEKPIDPTGGRAFEVSGTGFELPKGTDWSVLQRRWKALSYEERAKFITLRHVPARVIADVIETRIPAKRKLPSELEIYLRPNSTAPNWMKQISYSFDGAERPEGAEDFNGKNRSTQRWSVEIALRKPMDSLEKFETVLDEVGRTTGLKTQLEVPQQMRRSNAATHIHFSVPTKDPKKMKKIMEAFRRLQMVRLLDAGDQYDPILEMPIGNRGYMLQNIYDRPISEKHSLIRQVSDNRYELKEHSRSVKAELREVLELVQMDEQEALRRMSDEVRVTVGKNPEILSRIRNQNPYILEDFPDVLSEKEIAQAVSQRFEKAMSSQSGEGVSAHTERLLRSKIPAEEKWKAIERVLEGSPSAKAAAAIDVAIRRHSMGRDKSIATAYTRHLLKKPGPITAENYDSIRQSVDLSEAEERVLVRKIGLGLKSEVESDRRAAIHELRYLLMDSYGTRRIRPQAVKEEVATALEGALETIEKMDSQEKVVTHAVMAVARPSYKVPLSIREEARSMLLSRYEVVREMALQIAEKLDSESFGMSNCFGEDYETYCSRIWREYHRSEAKRILKEITERPPYDAIRSLTNYGGHGARYALEYVDIYRIPGLREEVERIIAIEDPVKASRLVGPDGFGRLFAVKSLEDFHSLRAAVEKSGKEDLMELFWKVAPHSLERHLTETGKWTSEIQAQVRKKAELVKQLVPQVVIERESRAVKQATPAPECSILWAKVRRILGR